MVETAVVSARARAKVYLVGAGPGDPKLLTLRAVEVLQLADVVLVDKLVGEGVLAYARAEAQVVDVGKRAGNHAASQDEIHRRMVEAAMAGKTVVRLKGGDPMIFGRAGEEIEALDAAGIAWEVVPGVTAATAAAARLGVSLTRREVASSVAFLTGHGCGAEPPSLRDADADTLVVYMGGARLPAIARELIARGRRSSTPVAIVHAATSQGERIDRCTLATLASDWHRPLSGPLLAVVGDVVKRRRT
jgi:uroporphyrin-III C-methyltransferase